jgi:hypothetical protein
LEVAVAYGFGKTVDLMSGWLFDRFARPAGVAELEKAAKVAADHLVKYHGVDNAVLESSERTERRWELTFRDSLRTWRVTVTGEFTLVMVVEAGED